MPARRFLTALLLTLTASSMTGDPGTTDRGNDLAQRFVAAVNATDETKRRESLSSMFSAAILESEGVERLSSLAAKIRETFGTLELHHGEIVTVKAGGGKRSALHVFARAAKTSQWQDFQFRLDDSDPPRATQLAFVAQVTEPIALPNGDITSPETLEWLGGYIERLARNDSFSGSILIASGDDVLFERTAGVADAAAKTKNDSATRFNMASGGKMFTAVAIAKLVEAGKLAWTTPLLEAVDGFPDSPRARAVTIHHLLTHTSGIGEYWTAEYEKERHRITTLKDMLPYVVRVGFDADPGATVAYSNSNFVLAGLAVEKASGMSFDAYVAKSIFGPLGMTNTGYPLTTDAGLAAPLIPKDTGWIKAPQGARGSSAGGSYSTPRDMLRFIRGLLAGRVLRPETVTLMTTSKTDRFKDGFEYGYGFEVTHYKQTMCFGHGGIAQGVDFALQYFPREDITLIMFGNRGAPAFDTLRGNVTRLITGER